MRIKGISIAIVALAVMALSACAGNGEAQAAYDACSEKSDYGLMKLDGASVVESLTGENARVSSGLSDDLDDTLNGDGPDAGDSDSPNSLQLALTYLGDIDCLVEQTDYPGVTDDLQDGDEWDGWTYSYEQGAGSEETHRFTAK